jgi:hypothetical protein
MGKEGVGQGNEREGKIEGFRAGEEGTGEKGREVPLS